MPRRGCLGRQSSRRPCRPKPNRPKPARVHRALCRLQQAVSEIPREARREVLEGMPPTARQALLAFMERQMCQALERAQPAKPAKPAQLAQPTQPAGQNRQAEARRGHRGHSASQTHQMPKTKKRKTRLVGVSHKKGGWTAKLCLSPYLYVSSRCFDNPHRAGMMLKVLCRARDLASMIGIGIASSSGSSTQPLKQALVAACHEAGLELNDLAPSFNACVDATGIVGCSVSSRSSTCLDEAVHHRSLLLSGRAAGWSHFREAWLSVLQATVQRRTSRAWGRARMKPLRKQNAEEMVDKARRSFELRHEERTLAACRKRLAKAVRAVEVLCSETRKRPLRMLSS